MTVYIQELKKHLRSGIVWSVALILIVAFFMMMFPAISKESAGFTKVLENFPPEVLKALGISTLSFERLLDYFAFTFTFILLIGAIQAMNLGVSIISSEIRDHTADFLLVKPVTRAQIVTSKLLAALTILFFTNILFILVSKFSLDGLATGGYDMKIYGLMVLSLPLVQLFFLSLGLVLSVWIKRVKVPLTISLGVVFGFYILNMVGQTVAEETIGYVSPFAYYEAAKILKNGSYDMISFMINMVLAAVFVVLAYRIFQRRDIPTL
jgi:ABC-2 type transport system permease protein